VPEFFASVRADLEYAGRSLRRRTAFTAAAVVTLALGIGGATSVFSVVDALLLRPQPFPDADRIVHVGRRGVTATGPGTNTSVDDYMDWAARARSFSAMGVLDNSTATLTGHGDPQRIGIARVSSGIFTVFGVRPRLGRPLLASDDARRAPTVALLSDDLWQSQFGGDSSIVGRTITLNALPVRVVGVLPAGFVVPGRLDRPIWENFTAYGDGRANLSESVWALRRANVSVAQAQAEMTRIGAELATEHVEDRDHTVVVDRLDALLVGDLARPLYALLAASFIVLLIACANVSNLLLAYGMARKGELAVRAALGASRGRIVRQLLTESGLLAAVGCAVAIVVARGVILLLTSLNPDAVSHRPPELNLMVLLAAMALGGLTTVLVGFLPAIRVSRTSAYTTLRTTVAGAGGGRTGRTRVCLAIAQLSMAVILLSAGVAIARSFARVLQTEPGIRTDHLITLNVALPQNPRYDGQASTLFFRQLMESAREVPGVKSVATTSLVPFSGDQMLIGITRVLGQPERTGANTALADRYIVSPDYFAAMGIRLLRGRVLSDADRPKAAAVCVIDETFARRIFGDDNAVGKEMLIAGRSDYATIVGVVAHVKTYGLDAESFGQIYVSSEQYPWRWASLVVRTEANPSLVVAPITRIVHQLDPNQPVTDVSTMEQLMGGLLRPRRFTLTLMTAFAVVATTLAVVGLYSVIAFGVTLRRREFGVRIALGAGEWRVAGLVLREATAIALIGGLVGVAGSLAGGRFINSMLFGVSPHDTVSIASSSLGLVCVAVLACVIPVRRATAAHLGHVLREVDTV